MLSAAALAQNNLSPKTPAPSAPKLDLRANPLYLQTSAPHAAPHAVLTIDHAALLTKTDLTFGITHTHYKWEHGNAAAVARARKLLGTLGGFQNTHIMYWGAGYIKTDTKGVPSNLDKSLTPRVNLVIGIGAGDGVITFCSAPQWMQRSGTGDPDAPQGKATPEEAPLPQYEDAFATLCAEIAKKYTSVKYFQVWNEFKGMWDGKTKDWDWERYTRLYNKIYKAVKAARPDALVGGFYLVFGCDGAGQILGIAGEPKEVGMPLPAKTRNGMRYFLDNAAGMDFFCVDKSTVAYHNPRKAHLTDTQIMKLTPVWAVFMREIVKELDRHPKYKGLPIMYSEYCASLPALNVKSAEDKTARERRLTGGAGCEQYAAAQYASIYNHVLRGAAGHKTWMLLWMQEEETIPLNALFTNTKNPSGGQPRALYWVMMAYKNHFAGAALVRADSSSPDVEVIASREAALVINKRPAPANININNRGLILPPYGVALLDLSSGD